MADQHMTWTEFQQKGYLQEVNRLYFHPLGLALELGFDPAGQPIGITGILDKRNEAPAGLIFEPITPTHIDKARRGEAERRQRHAARLSALGWIYQPMGDAGAETADADALFVYPEPNHALS